MTLAHLSGLDLRHAADGWHGIWHIGGVTHQFWLPQAVPDAPAFYGTFLPMDDFYDLRAHAARRLWRSIKGRSPGPDFRTMPAQTPGMFRQAANDEVVSKRIWKNDKNRWR